MSRNLEPLKNRKFDLLVIGGGINGAAIANIGARHGLSVALLEKGDFASGTSSKSSKLVHGGIRYLETFEFHLVREALIERYIHLKEVPYLVKPIRFLIPIYEGDKRPLWMMKLGVFLYNLLAGKFNIGHHQNLNRQEVIALEPFLKTEGLKGGVMYYDAQMDDARLCLENILSAHEKGAQTFNYLEVISIIKENGRAVGVLTRDVLNPEERPFEVRTKKIVAAGGPWTNALLKMDDRHAQEKVRTTKGIHIVYPHQITPCALLIPSSRDERIFFVIPWMGNSLIGTTDTDFTGNPDQVAADESDIQYLIEESKRVFPDIPFDREGMITFAGLRPLVRSEGNPSDVSREHSIFETASGIIFVTGGKYTTYRPIALECLSRFISVNKDEHYQLYGSGDIREKPEEAAKKFGLEPGIVQALMDKYGTRYVDVLKLVEQNPTLGEIICSHSPIIKAQIVYSIKTEMACTAEDIITRRLTVGYNACVMKQCKGNFNHAVEELSSRA